MILLLTNDLLIRSRIENVARHYEAELHCVIDREEFSAALQQQPRLILIDLDMQGVETVPLIEQGRSLVPDARIVGYCSHVMTDLIREARRAGAHSVLPNSAFSAGVAGIIAEAKSVF